MMATTMKYDEDEYECAHEQDDGNDESDNDHHHARFLIYHLHHHCHQHHHGRIQYCNVSSHGDYVDSVDRYDDGYNSAYSNPGDDHDSLK